jgi:F0F1-type ATP synthase alpha subunit
VKGMALNLQHDHVGVVIFGQDHAIHQGDLVYRTGQIVNVPVGPGNLGRVLDALGQPIDGAGPLTGVRSSLVEVKAPGIVARQSVREPLYTGGDGDGWGAHTTGKISRGIPKGFLARQSVREPLYTSGVVCVGVGSVAGLVLGGRQAGTRALWPGRV